MSFVDSMAIVRTKLSKCLRVSARSAKTSGKYMEICTGVSVIALFEYFVVVIGNGLSCSPREIEKSRGPLLHFETTTRLVSSFGERARSEHRHALLDSTCPVHNKCTYTALLSLCVCMFV